MQYTGKLFHPRGTKLRLDIESLSPIQGQTAFKLYGQLKQAMNDDEFDARIDPHGACEPLLLRFKRIGQTAAYAAFARGQYDVAEKLEAIVAFLPRLDRDDDDTALDELILNENLAMISAEDWEIARAEKQPLVAAFFTDEPALNDPLIHGMMSLVGGAFLDRLGMLD
jgi:hypothetical protein